MDPLMNVVVILMGSSAAAFFWLAYADGRRRPRSVSQAGTASAREDMVGARYPLMPRTIRQTPIN